MFPIFKLPFVALRATLDTFEFEYLVVLSFCSSRTCQIVKMTRSKPAGLKIHADCVNRKIYMKFKDRYYSVLDAVKQDHPCLTSKGTVKIRGVTVALGEVKHMISSFGPPIMATFWNNPIIGYQIIMEYVQDLFQIDIHTIYFGRDTFWIVDWIQERQNVLQVAQTEGRQKWCGSEAYDKVLKTCKAKELDLNFFPGDNFKYTGGLEGRERIHIDYGKWLTLDHLLEINVPDIHVEYSQLTDNDLNQLLKKWLAGGLPKLKYLRLDDTLRDAEVILDGLNVEEKPGRTYRRYGWNHDFKDNKELQRCDGATASIIVTQQSFRFALWPDSYD